MIMVLRFIIPFSGIVVLPVFMFAQPKFDDPKVKAPDEKTLELIRHRTQKLRETVKNLPATTPDHVRLDVEIFLKAVEWAVRHHEFYDGGKSALATLEQGLVRADEAAEGKASWLEPRGKKVIRAYRSKLDDSVQPYAVSYPTAYSKDQTKRWRLDILLHGRDGTICETKFLAAHNGKDTPPNNDFVQIDIYGRGNNAYRWAGESDVFEATEHFLRDEAKLGRPWIDDSRIVLRGFSMGGAGTWHLGLQHPAMFCVIGPGAGFTNTHAYVKSLPNPLPPDQEPLLHIYDAVDYAENAFNLPIVAYSGEKDGQKAAADNIEKRLKELNIPTMTHLIGPGLEHKFPSEWQAKAETEYLKYAGPGKGRVLHPEEFRFVTYTLKFPRSAWFDVLQLDKHYSQANIEGSQRAGVMTVKTANIRMLALRDSAKNGAIASIEIDGQKVDPTASDIFEKKNGKWSAAAKPTYDGANKLPGLQGPIDDAFCSSFLCVKGSGTPWNDAISKAADAQLQRFEKEWDKWLRGKLEVKLDKDVTEIDIATKSLILFGDPGANSLIAKVLPNLPITWTKEQLVVDGQKYEAEKYLPMMIYPNPLSPNRYVVLNSGHTFHEAEFKGTNALLFPHMGDYAVVRPMPTTKDPATAEVMKGGIFTDAWKVPSK